MSIIRCTDIPIAVYLCNGLLVVIKEPNFYHMQQMDESKSYCEWKKPHTRVHFIFIVLLTCKLNQPKMSEITTGLAWAGARRQLAGKGLRDISALMEMFSV